MLSRNGCTDKKLNKWWIFAVTGMANFCICFSINSLNLALPILTIEFGVTQGEVSWLAFVYTLIPCCFLLTFGKAADIYGYKKQYQVGFCFFAVASLLAPIVSNHLNTLIFFRAMQGFGYCLLISITQATVTKTFDENERGKALGINAIFVSVGLASGPSIGGVLLTYFSWHSIFYFPIPFCLLGLLATMIIMPEDRRIDRRIAGKIKIDWIGGFSFASFIGTLAIGLNFSDNWGLRSAAFIFCIVASILSLVFFLWRETKTDAPIIPLTLFQNRTFSIANAVCALSYMTQQLTTYLFPFFLIHFLMFQPNKAGIIMLLFPFAMIFASPLGGTLSDRFGTRWPTVIGLLFIALNCILVGFFNENSNIIFIALTLIMVGIGNGLSVSAINSAILGSVPRESVGVASGTLATMRTIGNTFGTAIGSVMLMIRQTYYASELRFSEKEIYLFAQRDTFFIGFGLAFIAIILVMQIPKE